MQAWRDDWLSGRWPDACIKEWDRQVEPGDGSRLDWLLRDAQGAAMWIRADAAVEQLLGRGVLELDCGQGDRLVREVGTRCFAALCAQLWGGEDTPAAELENRDDFREFELRHGGLGFCIDGLAGTIRIAVNRSWCVERLPFSTPNLARPALSTRRSALAPAAVKIQAAIELGSIELLDSLQLQVGEVLLTDVSRNPAVTLSTSSGRLATGRIDPDRQARTVVLD
ncbi:MAG TPA: hypothetical protein DDZ67_09075 [Xanthomonadaceae bacterium]|nr:hypothetical protein [Xanthomonadaceae bacterium]